MEKISLDKQEALELIILDSTILIDVRTGKEVEEVPAISEDACLLPFDDNFLTVIKEEEVGKEETILVYSTNGVSSLKATELLRANGYKAFNLEGGLAVIFDDNCWGV